MDRTEMRMNNQEATIKNLETQFGQFTTIFSSRTMGAASSSTEAATKPTYELFKAISTRSGKKLNEPRMDKPAEKQPAQKELPTTAASTPATPIDEPDSSPEADDPPQKKFPCKERIKDICVPSPFPHRLKQQKQEHQFRKFLDILKQMHINIPLIEAIQNMPNYAKYLSDMLSKRKRIREFETVAVIEECMAILHNKLPPK
ncbi:hypothetical protein HRI_004037900 [Hibiscus trionum]|uniref:Uncharacterized protein n=1 Tax=Hibiscus trionum TaxID=183268 RepID=A0A9W7MK93_HIBTR|nr:hypothetical protein HRI_004037900 [Hibiscus trionum]